MFGSNKALPPTGGVGIIGGSGLYNLDGLQEVSFHEVTTPFGIPSSPVVCGKLGQIPVYFIARHGMAHTLLPNEVNFRANIYAMKSLGAQWLISVAAVGSLRRNYSLGDLVVPDQIIDRTFGRHSTFFGGGVCAHVPFGEPYCPVLREALYRASSSHAKQRGFAAHDGGTYCCIEGPTSSTEAEAYLMRKWGAHVVGMTSMPEARLAREAELAYGTLCMVTDYDCLNDETQLDVGSLMELLKERVYDAKQVILGTIELLSGLEPSVLAAHALNGAIVSDLSAAPRETIEALWPILSKYLSSSK